MIYEEVTSASRARRTLTGAARVLSALKIDGPLVVGLALIAVYGLIVLYSASGQNAGTIVRTLMRLILGTVAMLVLARVNPNFLRRTSPWLYAIGIVLLLVVAAIGHIAMGAQRWLALGIIRFQPSELMKLGLILALAAWFHRATWERIGNPLFLIPPIVAIVISIVLVLVGSLTILNLPVAQFPNIAPPEIQILATYVGADAQTLEQAVATPLEQQMNGVDNMNYMYSLNATGNSTTSLIVNFDQKTDPNTDFILAQSRETQAASQLPAEVTNYGITVRKSVTAPLLLVAVYSPHGTYDPTFLANYAYINLADPVLRSPGIGNVQVFGAGQYAMRLWVKPDALAKLSITVPQIVSAIQAQNTVNPAGKAGGEPAPKGQEFTYTVLAQGRLVSPEQFGQIILRETPDGGIVRIRDVARIELGAQDYSATARLNGKPSAVIAAYQLPGSNAVEAAAGVRKLMEQLKQRFPEDLDFVVALDTTRSVTEGIKEIVKTLLIALVLVIFVVYLFLQGWRSTLIPLLAVPVSLVGTFILFPLFGFSINTLSLFGLVLAIGLVVDDAIVVVEGVERHMEEGLTPKDAALKAMEELSGPVVGIALVLSAVFVPTAFIPGITGRLYQQFAVTIAISVLLSAFNAQHVPARHRWLCSLERSASPEDRCCCGAPSGVWHCCWIFCAARADELSTGRGPGVRLRVRPTPERSLAGAYKGSCR